MMIMTENTTMMLNSGSSTTDRRAPLVCVKTTVCAVIGWLSVIVLLIVIAVLLFVLHNNATIDWKQRLQARHDAAYHRKMVNSINNAKNATWQAVYNPAAYDSQDISWQTYMTAEESQHLLVMMNYEKSLEADEYFQRLRGEAETLDVPEQFDARQQWPYCWTMREIFDQGSCGSCWAAAAASMISDRICITSNGTQQPQISVEDLLTCSMKNGCRGGSDVVALYKWVTDGVVTGGGFDSAAGCKPYTHHSECGHPCSSNDFAASKQCVHECHPLYGKTYEEDKYYGSWYVLGDVYWPYNPESMRRSLQLELMTNGPLTISITVYEDMQHYGTGVYSHVVGGKIYNHAIKLIGWGVTNAGIKYWTVANSFGRNWGEHGFGRFSMERVKIEGYSFGMPKGGNDETPLIEDLEKM